MLAALILALLSQPAAVYRVSPESGFRTVLEFGAPEVTPDGRAVFEGLSVRFSEGEPQRPALTIFVPVPPGAEPRLTAAPLGLRPTGLRLPERRTPLLTGAGLETIEVPAEPAAPPGGHAVLEGVIPLAGTTVAMVTVYPVAGEDPGRYASAIDLRLDWDPVPGGIPVGRNRLLSLVSPEGCLYWETGRERSRDSVFWGRPWARISLEETGGYTVTGDELENSGCSVVGSPASSLRMFTGPGEMFGSDPDESHQLHEVAFTVVDRNGDGIFDGEDSIEFFGRGLSRWRAEDRGVSRLQHRYASLNVYWLTWGGENGARTGSVAGEPDLSPDWGSTILSDLWMRQENIWMPVQETTTGWVWQTIVQGGSIQLPFEAGQEGYGTVRVSVVTDASQLHRVGLYVDGTEVLVDSWYGSGQRMLTADSVLLSGSSVLEIRLLEDAGGGSLGLASVHIEYPDIPGNLTGRRLFPSRERLGRYNLAVTGVSSACRAYDLSSFGSPLRITGGEHSSGTLEFSLEVDTSTVLILMDDGDWMPPVSLEPASPGRLVGTVSDGDRLIVVHPSMLNGVWGMEALSSQQGFRPVVATTREIYDEFGQGVADPGAIRSAVRWAMDTWSPGLQGLILAGDGHYDQKGHSTSQPVMIPPWVTLGTGRVDCVDDMYVMVHENAVLPEIPVSRIPAANQAQLGTVTAKLLSYVSGTGAGTWMNRALIVADDEWGQGASWNETEHTVNSELIAEEAVPRHMSREKFYLIEYPWPPGPWTPDGPHPEKPEAREAFLETLDRGFLFLIYQGHGSAGQIAHEVMMLGEDVGTLNNRHRLSVSLWATCDVGRFDSPGTAAIGETIVLHPNGGSISSVAATRGTYGSSNYQYMRSMIDSLCNRADLAVGEAVWQSKLVHSGSYAMNNRFYVMFGYPDLPLPMPPPEATVTIQGDTLRSGELNTVHGDGFQDYGLAFIEVLESSWHTVYTCLGGAQIPYLKYGGKAYTGTQTVEEGGFSIDCFVPVQSTVGDLARAAAFFLSGTSSSVGAADPAVLVEGSPSGDDTEGPSVEMWIRGYEGVEHPELTGDVTLVAELTDSSGICILGGPGRELTLFVDGEGRNVGPYFSYHRGSTVSGRLEYTVGSLAEGEHTLILRSIDGLGNTSMDTLALRILQDMELSITEALVYPNPGSGTRCFSFRVSEDARVTVSIFTVAGRRIEQLSAVCGQGYNQILWNGLDRDGDELASGPYIYKIRAEALGTSVFGTTVEEYGILAVIRED